MKKNGYIIIIAILLCVNVAQCLLMLRTNRRLQQASFAAEQNNQSYYTALRTTQSLWDKFVKLDPVAIREGLSVLNLPQEVMTDKCVTVFLAPYVCGACVDEQCETLTELLGEEAAGLPVRFLTPQFKAKDLRALFAEYPSVSIQTYDYDLLQDTTLRDLTEVLYFTTTGGDLRHVMLSVKGSPELTVEYINLIKNQCL